jgi:hypothetical protein
MCSRSAKVLCMLLLRSEIHTQVWTLQVQPACLSPLRLVKPPLISCSDLLQVHLRRHESRSFEKSEGRREITPPHTGHRNALLGRTNSLWNDDLPTLVTLRMPISTLSNALEPLDHVDTTDIPLVGARHHESQSVRHISGTAPNNCDTEFHGVRHISNHDYNSLIFEFPVRYYALCFPFLGVRKLMFGHQGIRSCLQDRTALQACFEYGISYLETHLPFIHFPTFNTSPISSILLLAMSCLGGFLNRSRETEKMAGISQHLILRRVLSVGAFHFKLLNVMVQY